MAISIDWSTRVIFVPQSYLTLLSPNVYELDVNAFRIDLKALEESPAGIVFPDTHRHNTEVVLAGSTFARTIEIINGYTIEFEDTGTPYTVVCVNANHNIGDVKVVNSVSLIVGNSGGLVVGQGAVDANDIAEAVWNRILTTHTTPNTAGFVVMRIWSTVKAMLGMS